jgi:hypothetical protein
MSNQKVEEVENAKSIALELLQAQVEGALAFHIHICHLLIAEAHHSVYGDTFEVEWTRCYAQTSIRLRYVFI